MEPSERERCYKQLRDNPLFKDLMEYFHLLQRQNSQGRYADLSKSPNGGILMREQAIGAENQMEDILTFISELKHETNQPVI